MNAETFNRLHGLRQENEVAGLDMDEQRPRFERLAKRHSNGTAPRAVAAFNLFQTPPAIAARMVQALGALPPDARVLEPSAGLGRLLDALRVNPCGGVVAVEIAPQCAGELYRQDRPGVKIMQRDFLTVTPEETGLFDAVIMNPPFHLRADVRHILHAREFLKPGGRLVALCLDTDHRRAALRSLASSWEQLPGRSFKGEGTAVNVVMLTIEK